MTEVELYQELGVLTKDKEKWKEHIPYVASLLIHDSCKIQAKALWLLGEMGLVYSKSVQDVVPEIAAFLDNPTPLLRERAVNALGRIGRGSYPLIEPYWADMFRFACDEESKVRLAFIWASENIATNTPDLYADHMSVFEKLLHDADDKVRMEAPEIFRVLGKRRHEFVRPYLEQLRKISETDDIHIGKRDFYAQFVFIIFALSCIPTLLVVFTQLTGRMLPSILIGIALYFVFLRKK